MPGHASTFPGYCMMLPARRKVESFVSRSEPKNFLGNHQTDQTAWGENQSGNAPPGLATSGRKLRNRLPCFCFSVFTARPFRLPFSLPKASRQLQDFLESLTTNPV